MFSPSSLHTYTVLEGETAELSLKAVGNPPQIKYFWKFPPGLSTNDDSERVEKKLHQLVIRDARRTDAGNYSVTAVNSYGDFKTNVSVRLDVLYPPE